MADTTARTLELLSLLQTRRMWSGRELMDRLGVSERTLRRDIDRLRDLGYPVGATTGPAGGYQLDPIADIPPLLLDEEEAVAIAIGLRTAAGGTVAGIEETSARALAKLEQVLPPKVRRQVNTLQGAVASFVRPWVTVDADVLSTLARACRDHERVRFTYTTREDVVSERNVEPHHLVTLYHRWYLVAYDRDRDDWRTFRLDRLSEPWPTRMRFRPRAIPGGDPIEYLFESMNARPMRYEVEVLLDAPHTEMAQRVGSGEGSLAAVDADTCLFRTQSDTLEWVAFRLMWWGVDFEVREPEELRDYLGGLASRLAASLAIDS